MKEWKDLTDKEIQIEIAMNLSKIANILEMAFQPEIRHYAVLKQEQEDRAKLLQNSGTVYGLLSARMCLCPRNINALILCRS